MTPRQLRAAANRPWEDPAIARAASLLWVWAHRQARMREIVRRPYAVIDNQVRPLTDVVYHKPQAMR